MGQFSSKGLTSAQSALPHKIYPPNKNLTAPALNQIANVHPNWCLDFFTGTAKNVLTPQYPTPTCLHTLKCSHLLKSRYYEKHVVLEVVVEEVVVVVVIVR